MNIDRILVTGANGDIANAIGRVIKDSFPETVLIGADIGETWPGQIVFSEMHTLPLADNPDYIDSLHSLAIRTDATCIIPCTEPELYKLINNWEKVSGLPLLMNDPEVVRIGLDKIETISWLKSLGINTPWTASVNDISADNLPVFTKPRSGSGSRNLEIIKTANRLALIKEEAAGKDIIAQELLEPHAGEYTCALFKYGLESRLLVMRRWLSGGLTSRMIVESVPEIETMLRVISDNLPEIAVINIQLRLTDEGPKIFEINPRLSSTVMMRHKIGFSDLVWWINALNGSKPPEIHNRDGYRVYRVYDEVVVNPEDV